jgi:hypothetical protein
MPLKRRVSKMHTSGELTDLEMRFLRDEPMPQDGSFEDDSAWWSMADRDDDHGAFRPGRPSVAQMWAAMGAEIVGEWAHDRPGRRPSCWWRFQAPNEPRRRLGGHGVPSWPDRLLYGKPTGWHWPATIPGGQFSGGPAQCDPADPPLFESEAAYLQRHELLADGEAERLAPEDFAPTPIKVPRSVYRQ